MAEPRAILMGASGTVGRALRRARPAERWLATYQSHPVAGGVRFDLARDAVAPLVERLPGATHLVLLAAVTNIDACGRDPEGTRKINVDGTRRVIDEAIALGLTPIYFSSDAVYDGRSPLKEESLPPAPATEYGRQKLAVERHLLDAFPRALVLRLAKVFAEPEMPSDMLSVWWRAALERQPQTLARDQFMTPIASDDAAELVWRLIEARAEGIVNVGGSQRVSRLELHRIFEAQLPPALRGSTPVREISIGDLEVLEPRAFDSSMDIGRAVELTGYVPRGLAAVCRSYLATGDDRPGSTGFWKKPVEAP